MNQQISEDIETPSIRFSGETAEYFRIWIVNMALTIVTAGIYSPWAKVRKLRYFYTHTHLADGHFDFHARPQAILFGRIAAVLMLGLYFGSAYVSPFAPTVVLIAIFALVPWLVVRSRMFRLRNTSFRGIRFDFQPNYKDAFVAYYGGALLTVVTLGIMTPVAVKMRNRFTVENSGFGRTPFDFGGEQSVFTAIFWKSIGLTMLGVAAYGLLMAVVGPLLPQPDLTNDSETYLEFYSLALSLPIFVFYAAVGVYYRVRIYNHVWNTSKLGGNRFVSTVSALTMFSIYATNVLAIIATVGLATPWAQIRLAKYRAAHMTVVLADDWQSYLAADQSGGSALGDEIGQAFDVDVDIGF